MDLDDQLASSALQDVLAFLDDYEEVSSASPVALDCPGWPDAEAISPVTEKQTSDGTEKRKRIRDRSKPKAELERLRHDVELLEIKLARLKTASDAAQGLSSRLQTFSDESADGDDEPMTALAAAWKLAAVRQYQRRRQSEITNRNLKRVLAKQLKVAKLLESLYAQRSTQQVRPVLPEGRMHAISWCVCRGRTWSSCTILVLPSRTA